MVSAAEVVIVINVVVPSVADIAIEFVFTESVGNSVVVAIFVLSKIGADDPVFDKLCVVVEVVASMGSKNKLTTKATCVLLLDGAFDKN